MLSPFLKTLLHAVVVERRGVTFVVLRRCFKVLEQRLVLLKESGAIVLSSLHRCCDTVGALVVGATPGVRVVRCCRFDRCGRKHLLLVIV